MHFTRFKVSKYVSQSLGILPGWGFLNLALLIAIVASDMLKIDMAFLAHLVRPTMSLYDPHFSVLSLSTLLLASVDIIP